MIYKVPSKLNHSMILQDSYAPVVSCVSGKAETAAPKMWIVKGVPPFNSHHLLHRVPFMAGVASSSCPHTKRVIWLSSPKESLSLFEEKVGG